jgi:hypothetical protein
MHVAATHEMPYRASENDPMGREAGRTDQRAPFQRSANAADPDADSTVWSPTTVHMFGALQATSAKFARYVAVARCSDQCVPSQRCTNERGAQLQS